MTIDRRDFMLAATIAAGTAVLSPVLGASPAAACHLDGKGKSGQAMGYYKTKVGKMTVTTVLDGSMKMPNELFTKADPALLQKAKEDNFLDTAGPFPSFVNTYFIEADGKKILIDAGAQGLAPTLGRTKDTLEHIAGGAASIDEVILTHAHPDHINGLLDEKGAIAFTKAKVKISEPELAYWYDDSKMNAAGPKKGSFENTRKVLDHYKKSGQLETFKFDADLGHGLSSVALPGHTPGHSGVMVTDGKDQLLIWADIVHNAFLQFEHPEQTLSFDTDEDQARATRAKIMDRVASEKLRIGGMHLPFTALGHVAKRGNGYAFVPQYWEADI